MLSVISRNHHTEEVKAVHHSQDILKSIGEYIIILAGLYSAYSLNSSMSHYLECIKSDSRSRVAKGSRKYIFSSAKGVYRIHNLTLECCERSSFTFRSPTIKMAHTDIYQESNSISEPQYRLLYGLNDKPPFKDALLSDCSREKCH